MTRGTVFRSRFVEQDVLPAYDLDELVAISTTHVLVCATQRKFRSFFVIKQRRLPLHAVVAVRTVRHIRFRELLAVHIFVAILTNGRGCFEIDIQKLGLEIRRLVAIDAPGRTMGTDQGKLGFRMIEAA